MSDRWKENAKAWRELYRKATLDCGIPHDGETVRAEGEFRRLTEEETPPTGLGTGIPPEGP